MVGRVCVLLAIVAGVIAENSDVLDLNADNFKDSIADESIILVEFFAPWCGHCKKLAPEYEQAATQLKKETPPIPLAKVDCPANQDLCQKYGVSGYPTLKIFRDGELSSDYNGPRTADGIVSVMKKQSGPSSRVIESVEVLKAFLEDKEHSVVGFFTSAESKLQKAFKATADSLRESFRFAHSDKPEVLAAYGITEEKVTLFQPPKLQTKLEEVSKTYGGSHKTSELSDFIKKNFMGLAGVRTHDNLALFNDKKPLCVVYYSLDFEKNPKGSNYWRNRVIKVAKDHVGSVAFAVSDKEAFAQDLEQLGLDKSAEVVVGLFDSKGQKYPMTGTFSPENLKAFVEKFLKGELEPFIKSEPVPENNDGPLTVVVGKNFDSIVNDPTQDVLIEFYAPWCGHCKSLAPKYEELAQKLKDDPNIVIAKSDATANDYPPQFQVQGFPTIFWVPAGSKSAPEKYTGGREVSDFIEFIKKKATKPPVIAEEKKAEKKGKEKKEKKGKKEEL
eukprot:Em0009g995a